jgi:4-amino-4-deoxy-L-arabinose transferase-like glycosyltransferase
VPTARRTWLALAALTVAAAALRLPFLGLQSLWYDETFTLAVVQQGSFGDVWDRIRETESTPPLYYLVTWLWTELVGSTSDAALRAPAAIAGVLCVPAAYLAARRPAGPRIALAVAALTAVSPVLVSYSLNARAYPLVVLFGCLSLWAMGEALERRGGRWLVAWALLAAACVWTHYYAGFLVVAELAVLAWRLPEARLRVAGAALAVGALFGPLIPLLADQRDERASHIDSLPLDERVEQAVRQLAAGPNPPSRVLEALAVALAVGGLVVGAYLARRRPGVALLGGVGAAAIAAPLVLAVVGIDDHFFMRNLLVTWACLATVAALGLTRARGIPLAAALAVGLALVIWTHASWRHQNADWDGALAGVRDDPVPLVVLPGLSHVVPNAYLRRQVVIHPLVAQAAWVLVEPGRGGRADLERLDAYPRAIPRGFRATDQRTHRGFRIIRIEAPAPTPLGPDDFGVDQLNGKAVFLAPAPPGGPPPVPSPP